MKKSIFYYLFAVVCTVCLFTACSDDDDDDNKKALTVDNIIGTYPGKMDIKLAGAQLFDDMETSITVGKVSDSKVKISLSNFTIPNVLPVPVNIEAECDVTPSTDELRLNGITTIDLSALGLGNLDVTVAGDANGNELELDITVTKMGVVVEFDGHKK